MSVKHRRTVGDTYPLKSTVTKNGEPVDITGSTCTFNFKNGTIAKTTIAGAVVDGPGGVVEFTPTTEQVSSDGTYSFNIKVQTGTVITTYLKGELILEDDL